MILLATGSEVQLIVEAAKTLSEQGSKVRVVSMPCTEIFDAQDAAYRESVLPSSVRKRIAVEALHEDFWCKYTGLDGTVIGMSTFGASAPGPELMAHFGFTVDNVLAKAKALLA